MPFVIHHELHYLGRHHLPSAWWRWASKCSVVPEREQMTTLLPARKTAKVHAGSPKLDNQILDNAAWRGGSLFLWRRSGGAVRAWSKQGESMILFPFTERNAPEYCCWRPPWQPQSSHTDMAPSSKATQRAEITSHWFCAHKREF